MSVVKPEPKRRKWNSRHEAIWSFQLHRRQYHFTVRASRHSVACSSCRRNWSEGVKGI